MDFLETIDSRKSKGQLIFLQEVVRNEEDPEGHNWGLQRTRLIGIEKGRTEIKVTTQR